MIEWIARVYTELGDVRIAGRREAVECHIAFIRKAKQAGVLLTMEEVEAVSAKLIDNGFTGAHDDRPADAVE